MKKKNQKVKVKKLVHDTKWLNAEKAYTVNQAAFVQIPFSNEQGSVYF